MTDKKPIVLKNVRLSYPSIRRPADSIDLMQHRGPSFTMHIPTKYSPLAHAYLWSALMGGVIPATRAIVGHDPQKLLPAPSADNRPMSLWDSETLLKMSQSIMDDVYSATGIADMFPKAAKPTRYYIEGGHFDMLPPGTFDPDDEFIQFDGSPTGRRLAPFVTPLKRAMTETPRWGEAETHPWQDVERYRKEMMEPWPHKVAVIPMAGLDYGLIEARVLAAMGDKRVRGILLDIESAGGEIVNPQLDLYRMAFAEKPQAEKVAKKAPPAYLQHDPTKRHKRRRKGK